MKHTADLCVCLRLQLSPGAQGGRGRLPHLLLLHSLMLLMLHAPMLLLPLLLHAAPMLLRMEVSWVAGQLRAVG